LILASRSRNSLSTWVVQSQVISGHQRAIGILGFSTSTQIADCVSQDQDQFDFTQVEGNKRGLQNGTKYPITV